ncbi:hypothetical protein [Streptomyces sp. NPDC047525]|uniref:hypothetical protein n=1 Tax=Streptomyces sp. NPDC047525 TaxID=3155264 RepID=UPI0034006DE2
MSTNPTDKDPDGPDPSADPAELLRARNEWQRLASELNELARPGVTPEQIGAGLAAAAERRGITGPQLLDRIARAGRAHTVLPDAEALARWMAHEPEPREQAAEPGRTSGTDLSIGTPWRGKTDQADLYRALRHAAGLPFEETTRTDEHGREWTEFDVRKPETER